MTAARKLTPAKAASPIRNANARRLSKVAKEEGVLITMTCDGVRMIARPDGSLTFEPESYRQKEAPEPLPPPEKTYNYFVKCTYTGAVKIGYSRNPYARLSTLNSEHIFLLKMIHIEEGDRATERAYHQRFQEYRLYGEWFRPEGKLQEFLENLECNLELLE